MRFVMEDKSAYIPQVETSKLVLEAFQAGVNSHGGIFLYVNRYKKCTQVDIFSISNHLLTSLFDVSNHPRYLQ